MDSYGFLWIPMNSYGFQVKLGPRLMVSIRERDRERERKKHREHGFVCVCIPMVFSKCL
jgi:hypothetical protein